MKPRMDLAHHRFQIAPQNITSHMKQIINSITLALVVYSLLRPRLFAQTPEEMTAVQTAELAARKAFAEKAYPAFLTQMIAANAVQPDHPRLVYKLGTL